MAQHSSYMRNRMALPASVIANARPHVPIRIKIENIERKQTTLPKGIFIGGKNDLPDVIVNRDQAAIIPRKERERGG